MQEQELEKWLEDKMKPINKKYIIMFIIAMALTGVSIGTSTYLTGLSWYVGMIVFLFLSTVECLMGSWVYFYKNDEKKRVDIFYHLYSGEKSISVLLEKMQLDWSDIYSVINFEQEDFGNNIVRRGDTLSLTDKKRKQMNFELEEIEITLLIQKIKSSGSGKAIADTLDNVLEKYNEACHFLENTKLIYREDKDLSAYKIKVETVRRKLINDLRIIHLELLKLQATKVIDADCEINTMKINNLVNTIRISSSVNEKITDLLYFKKTIKEDG